MKAEVPIPPIVAAHAERQTGKMPFTETGRYLLAFFILAIISIAFSRFGGTLAVIWLPNAALAVLLLRIRRSQILPMLATAWLANVAANLLFGTPLLKSALFGLPNLFESLIAAEGMRRWCRVDHILNELRPTLIALTISVLVATFAGATIGAFILRIENLPSGDAWLSWYISDALGMLVTLPVVLASSRTAWLELLATRGAMTFLVVCPLALAVAITAITRLPFPFVYVAMPMVLAALQLRPLGSALVNLLTALAIVELIGFGYVHVGKDAWVVAGANAFAPLIAAVVPAQCIAVLTHIGQRKRWELEVSEARFRNILDNAPIGMAIVSIEGHWLDVNRAVCDIVGYDKNELMARTFQDITHPDDLAADLAYVNELLQGHRSHYQMEKRYLHCNGKIVWVRLSVSLLRDEATKPLYFISQIEDITVQRVAEEQLRGTLALQTAILGAADVSIIATTTNGIITMFNRAAERMLGYRAEEVVGQQTPAIVHDATEVQARAIALSKELGRPIEVGVEAYVARVRMGLADTAEWTYIRKDGSRFPVMLSLTAIRDDSGAITGFLGIASDITERKQHDRAIREALHEKEVLLKEVYHRVKNNLQVITSLFNMQTRTLPPGSARDALRDGAERVRAMALVHEKLYQSATLSSISIQDYVEALFRDLQAASGALERGIRFVASIEPIQIGLETAVPLGLLLNELISNCLKHGFPDGRTGEIRISVRRLESGEGLLEIADDGVGYPDEAIQRRSKSLGLKLIETLSRQLDGELKLENRNGAYTMLRFRLAEPQQARKV